MLRVINDNRSCLTSTLFFWWLKSINVWLKNWQGCSSARYCLMRTLVHKSCYNSIYFHFITGQKSILIQWSRIFSSIETVPVLYNNIHTHSWGLNRFLFYSVLPNFPKPKTQNIIDIKHKHQDIESKLANNIYKGKSY